MSHVRYSACRRKLDIPCSYKCPASGDQTLTLDLEDEGHVPLPSYRRAPRRCAENSPNHPGDIAQHIRDHKHVMHVVIIVGGNIYPSPARKSPHYAERENNRGESSGLRVM